VKNKLIAGLFSLALILLVIVGPLWLAEKLEEVETAQDGIVPTSEVISNANTTYSYTPYMEFNNETMCRWTTTVYGDRCVISGNTYNCDTSINVSGFMDISTTTHTADWFYIGIEIDLQDMLSKNIDYIYFYVNCEYSYKIYKLQFMGTDYNGVLDHYYYPDLTSYNFDYTTGITVFEYNITTTTLNNIISEIESGIHEREVLAIQLSFENTVPIGTVIDSDLELNPQYFQTSTTTYDNETVTIYTPFISSFTPY